MRPENIPVNCTALLSSATSAYSVYQRNVEEEKEQEERQRKLKEVKEAAAKRKQEMDELRAKKADLQSSEALLTEQEAKFGEKC